MLRLSAANRTPKLAADNPAVSEKKKTKKKQLRRKQADVKCFAFQENDKKQLFPNLFNEYHFIANGF